MSELVCDFCCRPDPPWEYFVSGNVMLPGITESLGSWCACDGCRELIDADDREGLAQRAFEHAPILPYTVIVLTQSKFFDVKRGEARPIKVTPIHGRWFER